MAEAVARARAGRSAPSISAPSPTPTEELSGGRGTHLWQIDIVRLLTFAAVIVVHTVAFTEEPTSVVAAGFLMVLQFGREVFFALTGFVLVYSTMGRRLRVGSFWRRRFLYVGVPYVVWSLGYYAFSFVSGPHAPFSWHTLGADLIDGNAEYHLYFLLVSMQLYLVFPVLIRFVRATAHRAGTVLLVVGLVNAAWLAVLQWVSGPSGWAGFFWTHAYELLPTYAVYVLAGCYAAMHLPRLLATVRAHRARLAGLAVAGLAVGEAGYLLQTTWMDPRIADNPLQPLMIVVAASAVVLLVLAGDAWARGRRRALGGVKTASDISFGVYLAHPLVLTLLGNAGLGNGLNDWPSPTATLLAAGGCAVGATVMCLVVRRTPLALPLIGRARFRPAPATAPSPARDQASHTFQEALMAPSSSLGTTA